MPTDATEPTAPRWLDPGEVPSVPGYYWVSPPIESADDPDALILDRYVDEYLQGWTVRDRDVYEGDLQDWAEGGYRFYGPIPEPEDP